MDLTGIRQAGCFEFNSKLFGSLKVREIFNQLKEFYVMRDCDIWSLIVFVTVKEFSSKCKSYAENMSKSICFTLCVVCFNFCRTVVMAHGTSSWSDTYAELKKNHDEAYFLIEKAIKLEQEGKQNEVC